MKRKGICLLLTLLGVFASFESLSYAEKADKDAKVKKTIRFHVVITDKCNSDFSKRLLESVKEAVNGKVFVLTKEFGVMEKDVAEREKMALMERRAYHEIITDPTEAVPGDQKLTLRFNPPDAEGIYNADFLHFIYKSDRTWERGFNPGNYRYHRELSDMVRLRGRLVRSLTHLPFK